MELKNIVVVAYYTDLVYHSPCRDQRRRSRGNLYPLLSSLGGGSGTSRLKLQPWYILVI